MHLPVTVCLISGCNLGKIAARKEKKQLPSSSIIQGAAKLDVLLLCVTGGDILNYLLRAWKSWQA